MKILFGLGNPGKQYEDTRHNAGFSVLESFGAEHGMPFMEKSKFKAHIAELTFNSEKILLVKPQTFYNLVGESYRSICDYYNIQPEDALVIHDELALPFGTLRTRYGGSDAGNNGIRSVNQYGGEQSARLRIGISSDQRGVMSDADYVLARFSKDESDQLPTLVTHANAVIRAFLAGKFEATTHIDTGKS